MEIPKELEPADSSKAVILEPVKPPLSEQPVLAKETFWRKLVSFFKIKPVQKIKSTHLEQAVGGPHSSFGEWLRN